MGMSVEVQGVICCFRTFGFVSVRKRAGSYILNHTLIYIIIERFEFGGQRYEIVVTLFYLFLSVLNEIFIFAFG